MNWEEGKSDGWCNFLAVMGWRCCCGKGVGDGMYFVVN